MSGYTYTEIGNWRSLELKYTECKHFKVAVFENENYLKIGILGINFYMLGCCTDQFVKNLPLFQLLNEYVQVELLSVLDVIIQHTKTNNTEGFITYCIYLADERRVLITMLNGISEAWERYVTKELKKLEKYNDDKEKYWNDVNKAGCLKVIGNDGKEVVFR